MSRGRVLVVGGSDPTGGAGIQADIATVASLGGRATSAVTALTVQTTHAVLRTQPVEPALVAEQMRAVLGDIGADAVKTGMLATAEIVRAVAAVLAEHPGLPLVVDPVVRASSGAELLDAPGRAALVEQLFPLAALVTPNLPEAELLGGAPIGSEADAERAAERLIGLGAAAVLVKGGHRDGDRVVDVLHLRDGSRVRFESERVPGGPVHGTGCMLASGIAQGLAQGMPVGDAVGRARAHLLQAMRAASGAGSGARLLDPWLTKARDSGREPPV